MTVKDNQRAFSFFFLLAVVLSLVGLIIDVALIQPRLQQVRQLNGQRDRILEQIALQSEHDQLTRHLAHYLELASLEDLRTLNAGTDPVGFLGEILDQSELKRLELTTNDAREMGQLLRTQITLRLLGRYAGILDLLQRLESSSRLVTVDDFVIQTVANSRDLEIRLNVSIYDPEPRS